VVASAIFYAVACWSSSITERDIKKLDKVIKKSRSVLGCPLDSVREVGDKRILAKVTAMLTHESHPLHYTLAHLESSISDRLRHPRCVRKRYRSSYQGLSECTTNIVDFGRFYLFFIFIFMSTSHVP